MSHSNYTQKLEGFEQFATSNPIPLDEFELDSVELDWFGDGCLAEMIDEVSRSLETPIELAGTLGLAAISAAITQKYSVLIEPGFFESCNLWGICALEPSARKSPALKHMARPIREWERNQREVFQAEIERVSSERKTLEDVIKEKRKRASKLTDPEDIETEKKAIAQLESDLPEIPVVPKLLFDDCTPERLGEALFEQRERKAYLESEADSLFSMMLGRYSDDPKLDIYLKAYSGESLETERMGRKQVFLSHPQLVLGICPQPSMIRKLSAKPILIERGLLARFLYFVPKSPVGDRTLAPCEVSKSTTLQYGNWIKKLLDLEVPEKPEVIHLSDDAYEHWKAWQRELEAMLRPDAKLGHGPIKHWGGKLAGNTARVAAILHFADQSDSNRIGLPTMENAVSIARASISHAMKIHNVARTDDAKERAGLIMDYVKRNQIKQATVRDLHAKLRGRVLLGRSEHIKEGLNVLAEFGWCIPVFVKKSKPGRPTEEFQFHPKLFFKS